MAVHIDADTVWREIFDTLAASEQSCIRSALGGERLRSVLERRVLADGDAEQVEELISIYACLTADNAHPSLFVTLIAVVLEERGVNVEDLREDEFSCLQRWTSTVDDDVLATALAGDDAAGVEFVLSMARCVPDLLVRVGFAGMGVDMRDLSGDEMECLRRSVAAIDLDEWLTAPASDDAALAELELSMARCVPDLLLRVGFAGMGVDMRDLSGDEMECLRRSVAAIDLDEWLTAPASDDAALAELELSMARCVPDLLLRWMSAGMGVDMRDLSGDEMECLRRSVAATDPDEWLTAPASDDAALAELELSMARCVPDLLLRSVSAGMGVDMRDLSGDEMECLRRSVAAIDLNEWLTAIDHGIHFVFTVLPGFGLPLARCVPDVFVHAVFRALGGDKDLSADDMECLRQWMPDIDLDEVGTVPTFFELMNWVFESDRGQCVIDLLPEE